MTPNNDHQIKILNGLIEATLDSAHGYRDAADGARNPNFKSLFQQRSEARDLMTTDLQKEVRVLGGQPEDDGTMLASAHRMFLNLKNIVSGTDQSIVSEVEAGEDHIKARFEDALQKQNLSALVKIKVNAAYTAIKSDHDRMSDLKHALADHTAH